MTVTRLSGPFFRPSRVYHYDPVLWMVSSQPALGPAAPPATGTRKVGYKATLLIPQNLRFAGATAKVRHGRTATLLGSLALPAGKTAGSPVSWAPARTKVQIQRQSGTRWLRVKTLSVGKSGAWRTQLVMRATTCYRAFWPGDATRSAEYSLARTVRVVR